MDRSGIPRGFPGNGALAPGQTCAEVRIHTSGIQPHNDPVACRRPADTSIAMHGLQAPQSTTPPDRGGVSA